MLFTCGYLRLWLKVLDFDQIRSLLVGRVRPIACSVLRDCDSIIASFLKENRCCRESGERTSSLKKLSLALILVAAIFNHAPAYGKSYPSEFLSYQSICTVVEVNSDPKFEGRFDRDLINRSVSSMAASRLREYRIDVPMEYGRQCFPGKVGAAPRQLSLQFHVTIACGVQGCASATIAIVLYTFYAGIDRAPTSYPTKISYCDSGAALSNCLTQNVSGYFDQVVVPIFEAVQQIRKGSIK